MNKFQKFFLVLQLAAAVVQTLGCSILTIYFYVAMRPGLSAFFLGAAILAYTCMVCPARTELAEYRLEEKERQLEEEA